MMSDAKLNVMRKNFMHFPSGHQFSSFFFHFPMRSYLVRDVGNINGPFQL